MARWDVIVVGSGFGAAVMAARIGQALQGTGKTVLLLEKGPDPTGALDLDNPAGEPGGLPLNAQGNRFRHTYEPGYLGGVGELFTDPDGAFRPGRPSLTIAAGRGLGGGSNLYCGVSLRCPSASFDQIRGGRRLWPVRYTRAALDPYYARVEAALRVHRLAWTDREAPHWQLATRRDWAFAEGCRRIGATAVPLKLADDADANEGWWTEGQRFAGRQDLTGNYLADAAAAGVVLASGCEVDAIAPDGPDYAVSGTDRRSGSDVRFDHVCRLLVLGAGAVGSTGLLLRNQGAFQGERVLDLGGDAGDAPNLGRHLSANGDYGVTGLVGEAFARPLHGERGKPMASFSPSWWRDHRFIVIAFHAPPLFLALNRFTTLLSPRNPAAVGRGSTTAALGPDGRPQRDWGAGYVDTLTRFSERVLTMGCLALDACEGEVSLGPAGTVSVAWPRTASETEARWSEALTQMRRIYEALDGELLLDGYRGEGTVHTAHPLGGARMAEDPLDGVVDPNGEAWGNPNLFVVDGAILPSALGVNPSLTIAAVAEAIADRLVDGIGMPSLLARLA
ncbi:MAG: GMC family oxidoreductase [Myxococcota bacterium]